MQKRKLLFIIYLWGCLGFAFAQDSSPDYFNQLNKNLFDIGDIKDPPASISSLEIGALNGDPIQLNLLGILYKQGGPVEIDEKKAFDLIYKSAKLGNAAAQYNLGRFYMVGSGCKINFNKALEWLNIATDNGSDRAAYALGYMSFKGFGVPQNYKSAISWFELSSWPMAKHYLGVCYFFGFGVQKNIDKAILNFTISKTTNSEMFLKHISENVGEQVEEKISKELSQQEEIKNNAINKNAIASAIHLPKEIENDGTVYNANQFKGNWKGKLIELDWSGNMIQRVEPITCSYKVSEKETNFESEFNGNKTFSKAYFENNTFFFENLSMDLGMPFHENPYSGKMTWQIISSEMKYTTVGEKKYLIGRISTFSDEWRETGPPMYIVLRETGQNDVQDDEILSMLNIEKEHITLYPNPFESEVLIAYELDEDSNVSVEVYNYNGNAQLKTVKVPGPQKKGQYTYRLEGNSFEKGLYIVRIIINGKAHTKILIKK